MASYHYPKITCDIYFDGIKECGGGVLALDGQTGEQIWRHYTENEIFALNCNADLDGDGINDCIAAGRVAVSFDSFRTSNFRKFSLFTYKQRREISTF